MKKVQTYTLKSQGYRSNEVIRSEQEAISKAGNLCNTTGKQVAVILHDGDTSRLVRKIYPQTIK